MLSLYLNFQGIGYQYQCDCKLFLLVSIIAKNMIIALVSNFFLVGICNIFGWHMYSICLFFHQRSCFIAYK